MPEIGKQRFGRVPLTLILLKSRDSSLSQRLPIEPPGHVQKQRRWSTYITAPSVLVGVIN
ncbi:hypothetical protein BgiMline_019202, partial [Biomphalaria glabrata]